MSVKLDLSQLKSLLKSFYTLTQLKVVIIDDNWKEILSYPSDSCDFCNLIKNGEKTKGKCEQCLREFCRVCDVTQGLYIDKCHVGLTEAIFPLKDKDTTIGYIMFGQTTEYSKKSQLIEEVSIKYSSYGKLGENFKKSLAKIKVKTHGEIVAAAEILKTISNYITVKQLMARNNDTLIYAIYDYIDRNVYKKITSSDLCKALYICRTKLFERIKKESPEGLTELVNKRKIELSKHLLTSTDMTLKDIAEKFAFSGSNYYCKIFKKHQGISPKEFRKNFR